MARFQYQRQPHPLRRLLLSAAVFLLIASIFYQGIVGLSGDTRRRQREALENALSRGITYCYAVEGAYPQSLQYLKDNYGLIYDEDLFYVDYRVSGANLFPDVTIIEKED